MTAALYGRRLHGTAPGELQAMTWTGSNHPNFTTNKIEVTGAYEKRMKATTVPKSARSVRTVEMVPTHRENKLFGVHINGIRDRYQMTYAQGANPFNFVGFRISLDARQLTYIEYDGNAWRSYGDLPPKTGFYNKNLAGQGFQLSKWVPCYDWVADEGYKNFSTWVDNAR